MNWVMGLSGLITIFLVWKISDLMYKQNIKNRSTKGINLDTTKNYGIVIENNIDVGITGIEVNYPKIYVGTGDLAIRDNYITTP